MPHSDGLTRIEQSFGYGFRYHPGTKTGVFEQPQDPSILYVLRPATVGDAVHGVVMKFVDLFQDNIALIVHNRLVKSGRAEPLVLPFGIVPQVMEIRVVKDN